MIRVEKIGGEIEISKSENEEEIAIYAMSMHRIKLNSIPEYSYIQ